MNTEKTETKANKIQAVAIQIFNIFLWLFWILIGLFCISEPDETLPLWFGIPLLLSGVVGFVSRIAYLIKKTPAFLTAETICYLVLAVIFGVGFIMSLQNQADLTGAFGFAALYSIIQTISGFLNLKKMKN